MIQIRQPKHTTTIVWFYSRFAHACGLPCRSNGSKAGPHTNASYAAGVRRIGVNECNRLLTTVTQSVLASRPMKAQSVFLAIVLSAVAGAQQQPTLNGVVYGALSTPDGRPANRLSLEAMPLDVEINGKLPKTKTNERGEYRFENLPWGRYKVFGEDEKAGYSAYSAGDNPPPEVEVTPEHPKAELSFTLPPKAGFIHIHLKNRRTGRAISVMTIAVVPIEKPDSRVFNDTGVFTMGCDSDRILLVPPDK